jgi:hypothetical protein
MGSSHTLDQLDTCFDDTHAVANAGLPLAATLAERLGIEQAADALIDLGERPGAAPARPQAVDPGPRDAGGWGLHRRRRCAALWRHQPGARPPGHGPPTLGTFLRSFTFGHVRQLDRLTEQVLPGRGRPASSAHAVLAGG